MAKRKAREIWVSKDHVPNANKIRYSAVLLRTSLKRVERELEKAGYVRFVESPPRKKARKKK